MLTEKSIVTPYKGKKSPNLGPLAVMISTGKDLRTIQGLFGLSDIANGTLMMSKYWLDSESPSRFTIAGPVLGAPYAVALMETLIAWGAEEVLYFGWGGAVSSDVRIGDIIVPTTAFIDEGTSIHYGGDPSIPAEPSPVLLEKLRKMLQQKDIVFREGPIWTMDAIFRETRSRTEYYQKKQVVAVEMEISALFTAARFLNKKVAAVIVVSDDISAYEWTHGFKDERFHASRKLLSEMVLDICGAEKAQPPECS